MVTIRIFAAAILGTIQSYYFSPLFDYITNLCGVYIDRMLEPWRKGRDFFALTGVLAPIIAAIVIIVFYLLVPIYLFVIFIGVSPPFSGQSYLLGILVGILMAAVSKKLKGTRRNRSRKFYKRP